MPELPRPCARARSRPPLLAVLALAGAPLGCGSEKGAPSPSLSPMARPEVAELLRADLAAVRHPADGGGRAWLELSEGEEGKVVAGGVGRWSFLYEAGPLGVRQGGSIYFQVSPFWGWSSPQLSDPERAGHCRAESLVEGVELSLETPGREQPRPLRILVGGRDLLAGERLRVVYGAGPAGAVADRHAERRSTFWFAVDGDGDGVRKLIEESPHVEVLPGSPALLSATLSSTAAPGRPLRLTVAVLDSMANAGCRARGELSLRSEPEGLALPAAIELREEDLGRRSIDLLASSAGTWRVHATLVLDGRTLDARSNPVWVGEGIEPIFWADLHGHSEISDGTGTPEDYFRFARDVAALDVAALSDHDHFGMRALDQAPELWQGIQEVVRAFHEPGRFVTLLAYEWTSWLHGHRHVLFFGDAGEVHSSVDPACQTPEQLWAALRGKEALTLAHHSAGGSIATNWDFAPDPLLEPLTEISSIQGSSEAEDSPSLISPSVRGNFVRDALDRGYRLGFVGSGDGHDGHPGLTHLSPLGGFRPARAGPAGELPARMGRGGLAAIRASGLTRDALLVAMRARRTYATSGPRILIDARWNEHPMGSSIPAAQLAAQSRIDFRVSGTAPIAAVELVRSGSLRQRLTGAGVEDVEESFFLVPARAGEYAYLRVIQTDGGLAWTSPFFVE